jgi:carboxypeptidase C (cathepsin A)
VSRIRHFFVLLVLAGTLGGLSATAQEAVKPKPDAPAPKESLSITRHSVTVDGAKLDYEATAGTLVLKTDEGKATASIFFVAYTRPSADARQRPLTFVFNGGPGSSAVWLHLGAFGPRRVPVGDVGDPIVPPYQLVDNASTLLDLTDLVFIDPVSTGYSRAAPGTDPRQFHGVSQDIDSVGRFIRQYLTRFDRWPAPKFLAGESYGTTRAAGLAGWLHGQGIDLNGILLISAVLNFQTLRDDPGNDLPYPLFLPSYTATAWYHQRLAEDLQRLELRKLLSEVEKFALSDYTVALMKGGTLPAEEQQAIAGRLARYTALPEEFIRRANLRVDPARFRKELLRDRGGHVGRFDSRFIGQDRDAVSTVPDFDPSYVAVQGPYTASLNAYVRHDLKIDKEIPYEILTSRVQPWDYGSARNRYLNVAPTLAETLTKNRQLRVFVANGWYDLATPYFATEYTFDHMHLDPDAARRVTMTYYDAGHMMYVHRPSLVKLKKDVAAFVRRVLQEN